MASWVCAGVKGSRGEGAWGTAEDASLAGGVPSSSYSSEGVSAAEHSTHRWSTTGLQATEWARAGRRRIGLRGGRRHRQPPCIGRTGRPLRARRAIGRVCRGRTPARPGARVYRACSRARRAVRRRLAAAANRGSGWVYAPQREARTGPARPPASRTRRGERGPQEGRSRRRDTSRAGRRSVT